MLNSVPHSCENETTLGGRTFKRGIWYYSGLELIDHHDLSGLENPYRQLETVVGRETRPQFFINLLNRLRTLDYSPESDSSAQASSVCRSCRRK